MADLVWWDLLEQMVVLDPACLAHAPQLRAFMAAVADLPKVRALRCAALRCAALQPRLVQSAV